MKYFMGGTLFFPMDIITWVNALLLLTLVAFLLLLIWRMLKPLGTLYRITSLAQGSSLEQRVLDVTGSPGQSG